MNVPYLLDMDSAFVIRPYIFLWSTLPYVKYQSAIGVDKYLFDQRLSVWSCLFLFQPTTAKCAHKLPLYVSLCLAFNLVFFMSHSVNITVVPKPERKLELSESVSTPANRCDDAVPRFAESRDSWLAFEVKWFHSARMNRCLNQTSEIAIRGRAFDGAIQCFIRCQSIGVNGKLLIELVSQRDEILQSRSWISSFEHCCSCDTV